MSLDYRLLAGRALALVLALTGSAFGLSSRGTEFHVRPNGDDQAPGTESQPLRSVQSAAERAMPGDTITVHAGVYREWIRPPRGGESETRRIVYQAAQGERVEIKGSEVVKGWVRLENDVWKTTVPNERFRDFNPYQEVIRGDWFDPRGRKHHVGAIYLDGEWLTEAATLDEVLKQKDGVPLWFGQVDAVTTTLWARFPGADPNERLVEMNARRAVFYPDQPGRNFITVRGFVLRDAATPWAPPTAEQVGLIGTHWSKGWIIEDNQVSHSVCSGIALGKHGDEWDNTSADTAEGYVKTIERAYQRGWTRENIGHHVVRNNHVSHCEQAGIVGSLGAAFSTVTGNTIHDIHVRRLFTGAEMAGIKFHAAIDTLISSNHIYRTVRGLWLDWMAQGTRVSGNLFHDNMAEDLFVEVDHGPFVIDNNFFLSGTSLLDVSEGGAYVHNLFGGRLVSSPEPGRMTPFHPAHTTAMCGLVTTKGGDNRFYNNVFLGRGAAVGVGKGESRDARHAAGYGTWVYDEREFSVFAAGNIYLNGARPYAGEPEPLVESSVDPKLRVIPEGEHWILRGRVDEDPSGVPTRGVTTELLGKARVPNLPYENADSSPIRIDRDFLGQPRDAVAPSPGPIETVPVGELNLRLR